MIHHAAFPRYWVILLTVLSPITTIGQTPQAAAASGNHGGRFSRVRDIQTTEWRTFPVWSGGMLVGYLKNESDGPIIFTVDREGRRTETLFTIPGSNYIDLLNTTVKDTGEIVLVGSALTADGRHTTFVATISADRTRQTVTRVWPYVPYTVTVAPDGNIWTIGMVKTEDGRGSVAFHVLRRFQPDGQMLDSRNLKLRGGPAFETISGFRASADRVVLFTPENECIEFSLNGGEMDRYEGPLREPAKFSRPVYMALTRDDRLIISQYTTDGTKFFEVDRKNRAWVPVEFVGQPPKKYAQVLGFDGTTMVTHEDNGLLGFFNLESRGEMK